MTRYVPGLLLLGVALWVQLYNGDHPGEPVVLMGLGTFLGPDPVLQGRVTVGILAGLGLISVARLWMRPTADADDVT